MHSDAGVSGSISDSFLDALPPDLRKEVEENMREQKEGLERNHLQVCVIASSILQRRINLCLKIINLGFSSDM